MLARAEFPCILVVAACCSCGGGGGGGGTSKLELDATAITPSEVVLTWTSSASAAASYQVLRDGAQILLLPPGTTAVTDRDARPNERNTYEVIALLSAREAERSDQVDVRTPGVAPWTVEDLAPGSGPSLALGPDGTPQIVFRDPSGAIVRARRSGTDWEFQTIEVGADPGAAPSIAIAGDGTAHVAFEGAPRGILRHATDAGGGWTIESIGDARSAVRSVVVALDGADMAHVAFVASAIWLARQGTLGWGGEFVDAQETGAHPLGFAFTPDGRAHLTYVAGDVERTLYHADDAPGAGIWSVEPVQIGVIDAGRVAVATGGDLCLPVLPADSFCALVATKGALGWANEIADTPTWMGNDPALALDSAGFHRLAYQDSCYDLRVVTLGPLGWSVEFVDAAGLVGSSPSVAVAPDGRTVVAYEDGSSGNVRVAISP